MLVLYFGPKPNVYKKVMKDVEDGVYNKERTQNNEVWDVEDIQRFNQMTNSDHGGRVESNVFEEELPPVLPPAAPQPEIITTQNSTRSDVCSQDPVSASQRQEFSQEFESASEGDTFIGFTPPTSANNEQNNELIAAQLLEQNRGGYLSASMDNNRSGNSNTNTSHVRSAPNTSRSAVTNTIGLRRSQRDRRLPAKLTK